MNELDLTQFELYGDGVESCWVSHKLCGWAEQVNTVQEAIVWIQQHLETAHE